MPVVGKKPRLKYRGNIRHDMKMIADFCDRLAEQDIKAKGAPFLTNDERVKVTAMSTLMTGFLAEKTQ